MRAPEITYRYLYPKDVAGPTFEVLIRALNFSDTATVVPILFTGIPKDKILVLTNAMLQADPGATQACTRLTLSGFSSAGALFDIAGVSPDANADEVITLNWQGELFLSGGVEGQSVVRANAVYDAGVAANRIDLSFHGIVIPKANVAIF
ncbi:MAG: hypothetical protein V3S55_15630 [Nitrospiraceae bacterium]